nr:helix-turn-helix domain-containing protein [Bradyrhizobium sp. CCBAU 51765]
MTLFLERGFEATTVDIAAAADVSRRARTKPDRHKARLVAMITTDAMRVGDESWVRWQTLPWRGRVGSHGAQRNVRPSPARQGHRMCTFCRGRHPGLVPGIHVLVLRGNAWMVGKSPAMTLSKQSVPHTSHAMALPRKGRVGVTHSLKNASRSALMVSACVVGMPCGKPL